MKRNRRPQPPERLQALASQAADYALHIMRTTGAVPPTVIADTDEGYVFCMPNELADEAAKDRFAEVAKLFAIGYHARALVMVVESWVRMASDNGHLDPSIRPSEASDRKEMVALLLEDHTASGTTLIPILRDESGAFTDLGQPSVLDFGSAEGRFSRLMPVHRPNAEEAARARNTLLSLGMNIQRQGFDPTLN